MCLDELKNLPSPYILMLVGPPLSGKSSFVRKYISDETIISRDRILMDVYGSDNYNDAFNNVDQGKVDKTLLKTINDSVKNKDNVIIDMTNLSSKTRKRNLSYFTKDYTKIAIVFPLLEDDEYDRRNEYRRVTENKIISKKLLDDMKNSFIIPTLDEGFNTIIKL